MQILFAERLLNWFFSVFFFRKTLQIAKQLSDKALEAQACYSLGNTYTLLKDYEKAIEFHMKHLKIAQELEDRVGEGRACWSLGNAHTALGKNEEAIKFASKHLEISREVRMFFIIIIWVLRPIRIISHTLSWVSC